MQNPYKILIDYGGTISRDNWLFDYISRNSIDAEVDPKFTDSYRGVESWNLARSLGNINFFDKIEQSFFKLSRYYPEAIETIGRYHGEKGPTSKSCAYIVFDQKPKLRLEDSKIEGLLAMDFNRRGGKINGFYIETDKLRLCKNLGIDLIVDDDPRIALTTASVGIKTILMLRKWNLKATDKEVLSIMMPERKRESILKNLQIAEDWADAAKYIDGFLLEHAIHNKQREG